jgi:hypothetical protein
VLILIPPNVPYSSTVRGWYSRPISDGEPVSPPPPHREIKIKS